MADPNIPTLTGGQAKPAPLWDASSFGLERPPASQAVSAVPETAPEGRGAPQSGAPLWDASSFGLTPSGPSQPSTGETSQGGEVKGGFGEALGEFGRAAKGAFIGGAKSELGGTVGELATLGKEVLPAQAAPALTEAQKWGLGVQAQAKQEAPVPKVPSLAEIKLGSPGAAGRAADWAASTLGGAAGTVGLLAAESLPIGVGLKAVGLVAKGAKVAQAAAGTAFGAQAAAEHFGESTQQGVAPEKALAPALGVGLASGALAALPLGKAAEYLGLSEKALPAIANQIKKDPALAQKAVELATTIGKGAAGGAAFLGVQQLINTAGSRWAKEEPLLAKLSPEEWQRFTESAAAGLVIGGVGGALAHPFERGAEKPLPSAETAEKAAEAPKAQEPARAAELRSAALLKPAEPGAAGRSPAAPPEALKAEKEQALAAYNELEARAKAGEKIPEDVAKAAVSRMMAAEVGEADLSEHRTGFARPSQLQDTLEKKLPGKFTPEEAGKLLDSWEKGGQFKKEELEQSGLRDWLSESEARTLTKEEVLEKARESQVQVGEVEKKATSELNGEQKNRMLDLLGSRELTAEQQRELEELQKREYETPKFNSSNLQLPGGENYRERVMTLPAKEGEPTFQSSHFPDEANPVVHTRANDRVDTEGNKVLHVEEVQSDLHQKAREVREEEINRVMEEKGIGKEDAQKEVPTDFGYGKEGVPNAPFKSTSAWSMLGMKRMIQEAVEGGYDKLTWTTGEQQAERYDLSKQLDSVHVSRVKDDPERYQVFARDKQGNSVLEQGRLTKQELASHIGKELAEKAIKELPAKGPSEVKYSGLDLKVGGEGMKAFYDKILPTAMNSYVKKWGAKVGETTIATPGHELGEKQVVHSVDITPTMRNEVLGKGQPLFKENQTRGRENYQSLGEAIKGGAPSKWLYAHLDENFKENPLAAALGTMFRRLKLDPTIELVDAIANKEGQLDARITGQYQKSTNTIRLLQSSSPQAIADTWLHEMIHAATVHVIDSIPNHPAVAGLKALYKEVQDQLTPDQREIYGMKNVKEFLAEGFTNKEFQESLKSILVKSRADWIKTAWDKFVDFVGKLMGVPKDKVNALGELLGLGTRVMEAGADGAEASLPLREDIFNLELPSYAKMKESTGSLWERVKEDWKHLPAESDRKTLIGHYLGTMQVIDHDLRRFGKELNKRFDASRQTAITNWMQANGDLQQLEKNKGITKDKFKQGYEDAKQLSPKERAAAAEFRARYNNIFQMANDNGIMIDYLENYVRQSWKKVNDVGKRLVAQVNSGMFRTNPSEAVHRVFSDYAQGEAKGYEPTDKRIGYQLVAAERSIRQAIAAREVLRQLLMRETKDGPKPVREADGRYSVVIGGAGIPVDTEGRATRALKVEVDAAKARLAADPNNTVLQTLVDAKRDAWDKAVKADEEKAQKSPFLVKPNSHGQDTSDYRKISHPALKGWKWIGTTNDGQPILLEGEMWLHPDAYKQLKPILGTSKFREWEVPEGVPLLHGTKPGEFLIKSGQFAKSSILLGGFHMVQEGAHAIFHRVNPFNPAAIDFDKRPLLRELVDKGLMLSSVNAVSEFGEGLATGGIFHYIPKIGKLDISGGLVWYQDWLFQDYIPRLKAAMAESAFERATETYKKSLDERKISRGQLLETVAHQANAAFGELNYKYIGRDPTYQDILRVTLLAPDFLEARMNFIGQAVTRYGREQRFALLRSIIIMAMGAQTLNILAGKDNKMHLDKPFSFISPDGREYSPRSVVGDVVHLISDPRGFMSARLNPLWGKPLLELAQGRNAQGQPIDKEEWVKDTLGSWVPIPFQDVAHQYMGAGREESGFDMVVRGIYNTIGIPNYPYRSKFQLFLSQESRKDTQAMTPEQRTESGKLQSALRAMRRGDEPDLSGFSLAQIRRLEKQAPEEPELVRFGKLSIDQKMEALGWASPEEREKYDLVGEIEKTIRRKLKEGPSDEEREKLERLLDEIES